MPCLSCGPECSICLTVHMQVLHTGAAALTLLGAVQVLQDRWKMGIRRRTAVYKVCFVASYRVIKAGRITIGFRAP